MTIYYSLNTKPASYCSGPASGFPSQLLRLVRMFKQDQEKGETVRDRSEALASQAGLGEPVKAPTPSRTTHRTGGAAPPGGPHTCARSQSPRRGPHGAWAPVVGDT